MPPVTAARPRPVRGVGERQVSRARQRWNARETVHLVARFVVVEHAKCEPHRRAVQREPIYLLSIANVVFRGRTKYKAR